MTLAEAKVLLRDAREASPEWQISHEDRLVDAFKIFWASRPSEWEFEAHMKGAVLFARILHVIGTTPLG